MTVSEALKQKRTELKDKVKHLVMCKRELFFILKEGRMGNSIDDSVYPVDEKIMAREAKFYGCEWSHE